MTSFNVNLLLHYVLIICIEKFDETKAQIRYENYENKSVPNINIREIYHGTHLSRGNPSWNDLPVAFKAPDFTSQNYWNYNRHNLSARRTFLGDLGYFGYRKPNILPNLNTFYDFMNSFIGKGNIVKEPQPVVPKTVPEPYPYEYPFNVYSTTEKNFLPPPKPIRASIVKLETVTRGPETFIYVDPPRYRPNFRPVPTRKPNLNGFHIDELGFHSGGNIHFESEPHLHLRIPEGKSHTFDNLNSTIYMQSPAQVNLQKIKIPFAIDDERVQSTHSPTSQQVSTVVNIMDFSETEPNRDTTTLEPVPGSEIFNDGKTEGNFTDEGHDKSDKFIKYKKVENASDTINTNEERKANETKSLKQVKSDRITNSIKIVTELTLEGLSKNKTEMVNIPAYTKYINMSGLINYELNKLKENKVIKPRWDVAQENNMNIDLNHFLSPPVNANDDLSLDIKILKDTNWDGFTTEITYGNSTDKYGKSKQFFTIDENHFLNTNSSDNLNNTENFKTDRRVHDNNTIVVETRVTKSITKAIPISRDEVLKNDTLNTDYFIWKNQNTSQNNTFTTQGILHNEDEKTHLLINQTNREYDENYKFSNKKVYEKNFNISQHSELIPDFNRTESIHEQKPIFDNFFKTNIDNADAVDLKEKTESYLQNINNYTIYTSTSRGEPMYFENKTAGVIINQVRKRKHKRVQKNKRRRMGKIRQSSSITTQVTIPNHPHNVSQQPNNKR